MSQSIRNRDFSRFVLISELKTVLSDCSENAACCISCLVIDAIVHAIQDWETNTFQVSKIAVQNVIINVWKELIIALDEYRTFLLSLSLIS